MAGGTLQLLHLGQDVIVVGLFAQLLFFGLFLTAAIVFHRRIERAIRHTQQPLAKQDSSWRILLYGLYAASILILVRSIFRVVEYLGGNDGYIQRHEVFGYIFDGVLMFTVMIVFNSIHPGRIISGVGGRDWELRNTEMTNTSPENRARRSVV
jgi:ABC-type Mn2+/Zn2+ transport system permease subunit